MIQISVSEALKVLQCMKKLTRSRPVLSVGLSIPSSLAANPENLRKYIENEVQKRAEEARRYLAIVADIKTLDAEIKKFNQEQGIDSLMRENTFLEQNIDVMESSAGLTVEQALLMMNENDQSYVNVRVEIEGSIPYMRQTIRTNQLTIAEQNKLLIQVELSQYSINELGLIDG